MLAWAAYLLLISGIMSLAGLSLERAVRPYGAPTRWIWMCALFGSLILPVVLSSTASQTVRVAHATHSSLRAASQGAAPRARPEATSRPPFQLGDSVRLNALVEAAWLVSSGVAASVLVGGWWYGRRMCDGAGGGACACGSTSVRRGTARVPTTWSSGAIKH